MKKLIAGYLALGLLLLASCNKVQNSDPIELTYAQLPEAVQNFIGDNYPDALATEILKLDEGNQELYSVELNLDETVVLDANAVVFRGKPGGGNHGGKGNGKGGRHGKGGGPHGHGTFIAADSLSQTIKDYFTTNLSDYTVKGGHQETLCSGTVAIEVFASNATTNTVRVFDTAGTYLFAVDRVSYTDLPQAVKDYITANFPNNNNRAKAVKMTLADGTIQYSIYVRSGRTHVELILSESGALVCQR